eukprot:TRINITY_DN710_c0_g1_i3.p1 TRINITY_DN710_c0_g1~~TRINITY_DN710_c0_g1_i3.p1  ORF type:complete len:229 (+),score=54.66 TRINITY_DN710_c0_g1_i3:46-687(+)
MQRLFGKKAPAAPAPTIGDTTDRMDKRLGQVEGRIKKIDDEMNKIREQLKRANPSQQARLKKRAMALLKQKRMYEGQREMTEGQIFNMEQVGFAIDSVKDTVDHVNCLKSATQSLKVEQKKLDIGKIENMQDELQDMFEDNDEIQEILGRSYMMPEDIDDEDLDAELAGLEDDMLYSGDTSYLDEALAPPSDLTQPQQQEETDPARLEQQLGL